MPKSLWHTITYLGEKSNMPQSSIRSISNTNRLLFILFCVGLINFISDFLRGLYLYTFLDFIITFLAGLFYYLHGIGFYRITFHILVLFLTISTFLFSSIDGFRTGLFLFFFPLIAINFFLVGIKNKRILFSYLSLTLILLLIAIVTDFSLFKSQSISNEDISYLFWESLISMLIFTGYSLLSVVEIDKGIEEKLNESRANLNAVLNNGLMSIIFLDKQMKIKKFNEFADKNALNLFGKRINVGDNFLDFILKRDKRLIIRYFLEALKGRDIKYEMNLKPYDKDLWYEIILSPSYSDDYSIEGIILASLDVTEKKMMELEIQLARKKAEAANYGKSQFLSSISQEIRTPMNTVIGIAGSLLEKNPKKDQIEKLKNLKSAAENFLIIINDVLDLNRLESGKFALDESEFNLNHLVTTISNFTYPVAQEKNIELMVVYDTGIPEILLGDSIRLSQIITNLIVNAIKHTDEGKVVFEVKQEEANLEYTQIGFTISDSGIGIAEDSVDMLFEVYDLSYSNNHVKVGGSGLGLVITKKLLDYMNTTIFVESEIGKGTKFYFTIKFKNSEMSFSKIKNKYSERINFIENRLPKGIRILLVEDYLINQLVVSEFLSKWEIHLDIADNGLRALENINEKSYDLILMDLQMPDMDGFQATKMIRDHVDFSKSMVPIIAMTASPASEIHEKVKASGMNDFISKPFEPEDLFNKILRHLENKNHST